MDFYVKRKFWSMSFLLQNFILPPKTSKNSCNIGKTIRQVGVSDAQEYRIVAKTWRIFSGTFGGENWIRCWTVVVGIKAELFSPCKARIGRENDLMDVSWPLFFNISCLRERNCVICSEEAFFSSKLCRSWWTLRLSTSIMRPYVAIRKCFVQYPLK